MKAVLLDPAFFTKTTEPELQINLRFILATIQANHLQLYAVKDYWTPLWEQLIAPLQKGMKACGPAINELRKLSREYKASNIVIPRRTRVYGFLQMFNNAALTAEGNWHDLMGCRAKTGNLRQAETGGLHPPLGSSQRQKAHHSPLPVASSIASIGARPGSGRCGRGVNLYSV